MTLAAFGVGFFLLGCVMNVLLPRWMGATDAWESSSGMWLTLTETTLDALLLVAFVRASQVLGWRETRLFWGVVLGYAGLVCVVGLVAPLVVASSDASRALLPWLRGAVALVLLVCITASRNLALKLLRPIALLLGGCGFATAIAGLAVPIRAGLLTYSVQPAPVQPPVSARLQHVPSPSEYADLMNPF